jgi:hypothetical protein
MADTALDLGASLDSILDGGSDTPTDTAEVASTDPVEDTTEVGETPAEDEPAEQPAEETTDEPVEGEQPPVEEPPVEENVDELSDEEIQATPVTKDGKNRIVPKNRFDKMHSALKIVREAEARLGMPVTVEEIERNYAIATDRQVMQADLLSGDGNRIGKFLKFWTKSDPNLLPALATRSLDMLQSTAPQVYERIQGEFQSDLVSSLYEKAAQMKSAGHPAYKKFLYGIQTLDFHLNQGYREDAEITVPDAVDERLARAEALERADQERRQTRQVEAIKAFRADVDSTIGSAITADLEASIAPIAANYKDRPTVLDALKQTLHRKALEDVSKDKLWGSRFKVVYEQAELTGNEADREAAVTMYTQRFQRALRQHKAAVIKEHSAVQVDQNAQKRDKLATAAQKKEPSNGGSPTNQLRVNGKYAEAAKNKDFNAAFDALF